MIIKPLSKKERALRRLQSVNTLVGIAMDQLNEGDFEEAFVNIEQMRTDLDDAAFLTESLT